MTPKPGITQEELEASLRRYYGDIRSHAYGFNELGDPDLFTSARQSRAWRGWARGLVALAATVAIAAAVLVPRFAMSPSVPGGPSTDSSAPAKIAPDPSLSEAGISRSGELWVSYKQKLLLSSDGGRNWSTVRPLTSAAHAGDTVAAVYVLDSDHFWTVLTARVLSPAATVTLSGTANGGGTWIETMAPAECEAGLIALSFLDPNHGFMVCQQANASSASQGQSVVFQTGDGGRSWTRQGTCGTSGMLMTASDDTTLWLAGAPGASPLVWVSHDEGQSCSPLALPGVDGLPSTSIVRMALGPVFSDSKNGRLALAVESPMQSPEIWFYHTADGGATWSRVTHRTGYIAESLSNSAYGSRLVTVSVQHMAVSDDNGRTWTEFDPTGLPSGKPLSWLAFSSASRGVALVLEDYNGLVLYSTGDGGRTWSTVDLASALLTK